MEAEIEIRRPKTCLIRLRTINKIGKLEKNAISAHMLEVPLLEVGTVLGLKSDAWSMATLRRQATNQYDDPPLPPPPLLRLRSCVVMGTPSAPPRRATLFLPITPVKAARIIAAGMRAGVALRPETPVSVVLPLLWPRQLLHCVDVLAVNPGFGGQTFDSSVLAKVTELRSVCPGLDIQVCG